MKKREREKPGTSRLQRQLWVARPGAQEAPTSLRLSRLKSELSVFLQPSGTPTRSALSQLEIPPPIVPSLRHRAPLAITGHQTPCRHYHRPAHPKAPRLPSTLAPPSATSSFPDSGTQIIDTAYYM